MPENAPTEALPGRPDPSPAEGPTFAELGVASGLVRALRDRGIRRAFPIQAASLPDALAGRDILGRGRTGSGKTVAFALPLLARILEQPGRRRPRRPRGLVLVPTRELAVQVADTVDHLAAAVGLTTMTVFGGVRYTGQIARLQRGVDVVIATPGRLEDLVEQGMLELGDVVVAVLDEADLMADMGFLPPVTRVLEALRPGQRMLFSATLDGDVAGVVERFLTDPLEHAADDGAVNPEVVHHLFVVGMDTKRAVVAELVRGAGRTMLFTRTRTFAERLAAQLADEGIGVVALHGDLRQGARQRNLAAFSDGTAQVLVATDIAARGIHVDDVGLVLHVDPPVEPKAFLHRSGRTARAGADGLVVTLATRQQRRGVRAMMEAAGITPVETEVTPAHPILREVRAPRTGGAASGRSIFEPDPDDLVPDDDERGRRGRGRPGHAFDRGPRADGSARKRPAGRGSVARGSGTPRSASRQSVAQDRPAKGSGSKADGKAGGKAGGKKSRWTKSDHDKRARTAEYLAEHGLGRPHSKKRTARAGGAKGGAGKGGAGKAGAKGATRGGSGRRAR